MCDGGRGGRRWGPAMHVLCWKTWWDGVPLPGKEQGEEATSWGHGFQGGMPAELRCWKKPQIKSHSQHSMSPHAVKLRCSEAVPSALKLHPECPPGIGSDSRLLPSSSLSLSSLP